MPRQIDTAPSSRPKAKKYKVMTPVFGAGALGPYGYDPGAVIRYNAPAAQAPRDSPSIKIEKALNPLTKPGEGSVSSLRAAGVEDRDIGWRGSSLRAASEALEDIPDTTRLANTFTGLGNPAVRTPMGPIKPTATEALLNGPVGNPEVDAALQRIWQGLRASLQGQLAQRQADFAGIRGQLAKTYADAESQMNERFGASKADLMKQMQLVGGPGGTPTADWAQSQGRLQGLFGSNKATGIGTTDWLTRALEDRLKTTLSSAFSGEAFQRGSLLLDLQKAQAEAAAA